MKITLSVLLLVALGCGPKAMQPVRVGVPIRRGAHLWSDTNRAPFALVLDYDPAHEFDGGPIRPGVFIRHTNSIQMWIPQESVRKAWTD